MFKKFIIICSVLCSVLVADHFLLHSAHSEGFDSTSNVKLDVLDLKNMDILDVLKLISQKSNINIIASQNVKGSISVYLRDIQVLNALKHIVDAYGWAYVHERDVIKVMTAQEFLAKYGHKFGQELTIRISQLNHAKVPDVVAILNQIKSDAGKIVSDDKTGTLIMKDSQEKLIEFGDIIKKVDVPVQTEVFELVYAKAEEISAKVSELLTPSIGQLKSDERTNVIVITDVPKKIKEIGRIIKAFDTRELEVLIEAKILQIGLSDDHKMGIDWEGILNQYHGLNFVSDFDILTTIEKKGRVSIGTLSDDNYTVLLEALDTVGVTDILSSPSITVVNNKEAKILVGSSEPYVTSTTTTTASGPTTTAESVQFIEVGVKLYVTPTIHRDGFITMKIKPEVSSVTSNVTTSNNNTIPIVETSEAETTVMVKDGVTIVIGGLIKDEKIKTTKKVPFLGDIPILNFAFSNVSDSVTKTEIVIFLTPKIISGDADEDMSLVGF